MRTYLFFELTVTIQASRDSQCILGNPWTYITLLTFSKDEF